ncbi:MAG: heavy-metal-associated domain-containing protein [Phycisphaeraceae bacterium]|nr:heavy-metal-associated domain-containing protein [Phycisphaerales bacterium]QOJ18067.1 MAG: heavy-metal-associated domain-containing protein [Phycisphaeraceae bacterium]
MSRDTQTSILIGGMRDNRCRERLTEALERVRGVHHVEVSLYRGRAIVSHDASCTGEALRRVIEEAGYNASINGKSRNPR